MTQKVARAMPGDCELPFNRVSFKKYALRITSAVWAIEI